MSKRFFCFFFFICAAFMDGKEPPEKKNCGTDPSPIRIAARHIENKGFGYNTGYTTLEAFLAAPTSWWNPMPFLDLRGHVFDNGTWAANFGMGVRSMLWERIFGGYAYYDYRSTHHQNPYNQISFGFETLGTSWDVRVNGYVPVGKTKSGAYDLQFNRFGGNYAFITQRFEYALAGANGEAGGYLLKGTVGDLYGAAGPYYFKGTLGDGIWGGAARLKATYKDTLSLEVNYSYDHVFKNIVQGQIGFSWDFGYTTPIKKDKKGNCTIDKTLYSRMTYPVVKNEIIPVAHKKEKSVAINPQTGEPYLFWFVDNLSHSAGTYESPFSTLLDAEAASSPYDVIYVFPGDFTSTGLSSGITLQSGQQLLGATINHGLMTTLGPITIPMQTPFGSNAPLLSNGAGDVVTLASNNVVSGLYIQNTAGNGIAASGSNNATLTQNYIQGNSTTYNGIELDNTSGRVSISANTIINQAACVNINNTNPISNTSYLVTNSTLHSEGGDFGINISYTEGSNNYFLSANNNLYGSATAEINIFTLNTIPNTPHIFDITNCLIGTNEGYGVKQILGSSSVAKLNTQNNVFNSQYGILTDTFDSSKLTTIITKNKFNISQYAFQPTTLSSSSTDATFSNNTIRCYESTILTDSGNTSTLKIQIKGNTASQSQDCVRLFLAQSAIATGSITDNTFSTAGDYGIRIETYNDTSFTGDIKNNNIIQTGNYGIDIFTGDNSSFTGDINNNRIQAVNFLIKTQNVTSSTYSGNIIGNTFVGQDDDDTILWEPNTSGTIFSTISNNIFTGNYDALDLINSGTGTTTFNILNNTIRNSGTTGIFLVNSGTNLQGTISENIFQGFGDTGVSVTNSAGTMCLQFNDNTANPYPNAYSIEGTVGTLNLVTPTGNFGQLITSGTTPVSSCP